MGFHLGCQSITFGGEQKKKFPEVFDTVQSCGYEGIEIGFRHLGEIQPKQLQEMLAQRKLVLAGSHIGGNLEDVDQAEGEKNLLEQILDFLNAIDVKFLMYSGLRYKDDQQLAADIAMINRSATECAARGVKLCYHNHNWEFENDELIMKALISGAKGDLWFCPDVGWVYKGQKKITEFLDAIKDRLGYVHYKDFAAIGGGTNTVELGDGIVPLQDVTQWLKKNVKGDMWVVAEQDKTAITPAETVKKNALCLKKLFGK